MTALLAVAGFLTLAAAGDYELVTIPPAEQPICAKSLVTCETAIKAVRDHGLFADMGITAMWCVPRPTCFTYESNTIKGYNRR